MEQVIELAGRSVLIGAGATVVMDVWAALLRRFGVPSLDLAYLGRWIGHLPRGQWKHRAIASAPPVRGERILGWCAHYTIGIGFAALLLMVFGLGWAHEPTLLPALIIGIATVAAPLLVLQPALGAGIASSRTPTPLFNSLKSVVTHTVFGLGLFAAAHATAALVPGSL